MPLRMWAIVMFQTACRGFASAEIFISFLLVSLVPDACLLFDGFWLPGSGIFITFFFFFLLVSFYDFRT